MIDKKISLGTVITVCTIIGTFIFTQGATASRIEANENKIEDNSNQIKTSRTKTQSLEVGQEVWLNFTSYSSGTVPIDGNFTVVTVTPTTFTVTIPSLGGTITGNVSVYLPTDFCFYLVGTGTVTNINQFFPLFIASLPSVSAYQTCSLTLKGVLPYINHPVAQSGANVSSSNSNILPKQRGLMLQRGQALYCSVSGATALTNGFYCNVQAGYY